MRDALSRGRSAVLVPRGPLDLEPLSHRDLLDLVREDLLLHRDLEDVAQVFRLQSKAVGCSTTERVGTRSRDGFDAATVQIARRGGRELAGRIVELVLRECIRHALELAVTVGDDVRVKAHHMALADDADAPQSMAHTAASLLLLLVLLLGPILAVGDLLKVNVAATVRRRRVAALGLICKRRLELISNTSHDLLFKRFIARLSRSNKVFLPIDFNAMPGLDNTPSNLVRNRLGGSFFPC